MITIDAKDKTLGRLASEVAKALLAKHSPSFAKNIVTEEGVTVVNASRVKVSGTKTRDKEYVRYSGYPGGQKLESYAMLVARKGEGEAIRKAVLGMLPKNRLQQKRINLLTIEK